MQSLNNLYYPCPFTGLPKKVKTVMEYFYNYVGSLVMSQEVIDGTVISTVFLAMDVNEGRGPRVITFETRVFPYGAFPTMENCYWVRGYATPKKHSLVTKLPSKCTSTASSKS